MNRTLSEFLRKSDIGTLTPSGAAKVIVGLSQADPDEACLNKLRSIGLRIDQVIKNKIIGSIAQEHLDLLKANSFVAEVELSTNLKLHS